MWSKGEIRQSRTSDWRTNAELPQKASVPTRLSIYLQLSHIRPLLLEIQSRSPGPGGWSAAIQRHYKSTLMAYWSFRFSFLWQLKWLSWLWRHDCLNHAIYRGDAECQIKLWGEKLPGDEVWCLWQQSGAVSINQSATDYSLREHLVRIHDLINL